MSLTLPFVVNIASDAAFQWISKPDSGYTAAYDAQATASVGGAGISVDTGGGAAVGGGAFYQTDLTWPGGSYSIPASQEFLGWESGTASASMTTTLAFHLEIDAYDEPSGGSRVREDGAGSMVGNHVGTVNGWPNNLRQVHGRYVIKFADDVDWTADGTMVYDTRDTPDDPIYEKTETYSNSGTYGTTVAGERVTVFNPALEFSTGSGVPYITAGGGADSSYPVVPEDPDGLAFGEAAATCTSIEVDWGKYDDNHPVTDPATGEVWQLAYACTAVETTVTPHLNTYGDSDTYQAWAGWRAGISASARDWTNAGISGLRGNVVCQQGDYEPALPVGAVAVPYTVATQIHDNIQGPVRWYDAALTDPDRAGGRTLEVRVLSALVGFPLDAESRRAQADFYGEHEALWILPPDAGITWAPFEVGYGTANIVVDDMVGAHPAGGVNITGTYTWQASGCATGTSGSYRTVSAITAGATLSRAFLSDWSDCAADPTAYAAALPAGDAKTYLSLCRDWYGLMRKVTSGADIFNWSNRRWLKVTGKVDSGTATFTLRITATAGAVTDDFHTGAYATDAGADPDDPDLRTITVDETSSTVDVEGLSFGATDTDVYIDLADVAARLGFPLIHVQGIQFRDLDTSRTYSIKTVSLVMGTAGAEGAVTEGTTGFGFFTGGGTGDDCGIVPVVDGAVGARQMVNGAWEWGINIIARWRQSDEDFTPTYSPRGKDCTRTFAELRLLTAMQEGVSVGALTDSSEFPNWALFLDAGWHSGAENVSATVKCADMLVPVALWRTWTARGTFRGIAFGVAIDQGTHWAADAQTVEIEAGRDAGWDEEGTATTDDNGAWLTDPLHQAGARSMCDDGGGPMPYYNLGYRFRTPNVVDTGTQEPLEETTSVANLSAAAVALRGDVVSPETSPVALDCDATGWLLRAYVVNGVIRVQRRTRDGGAWTTLGERAGADPWPYWAADGKAWCIYGDGGTVKAWDLEDNSVATVATGKHPSVAWNRGHSLRAVTYWAANIAYVLVFDGQGNDILGGAQTVVSPAQETTYAVAWRADGTLEVEYSDGTTVHVLTSSDLGRTWS